MTLHVWRVFNGYTGFSAVHSIVLANTEKEAKDLAGPMFQANARSSFRDDYTYPERYWTNLTAEKIIDGEGPGASEVCD